jgi:hypothetical protein
MPVAITAIMPVDDGVFVGTAEDLVWLGGATFDGLAYQAKKLGPVVLGSGIHAPGERLKYGDGRGQGNAALCIAGGEVVACFGGGGVSALTGDRYRTGATEVCATFREVGGVPQYIAIPQ